MVERAVATTVPKRVGRFDILLPIASGGMAVVFLARARTEGGFERDVALKLTHAHLRETEEFAKQLMEEARLAVQIHHPNVVGVLDVGEDPLGVFLVLEYVEGTTLAGLKRSAIKLATPFPLRIGARVVIDALRGLHAAHELRDDKGVRLGLVHRDFSPQNILVGMDGVSMLTDFGVAKAASRLGHTATGMVKGKTHYMAPEQARGSTLDRRCDVWAAGVILWELIARQRLYSEDNDAAIILRLVSQAPPRLRTLNPAIPRALDEVVASALSVEPDHRCPTAQILAAELEVALEGFEGVATHEEVAAFVERAVGEQIRKRRKTAQRKLEERASEAAAEPARGSSPPDFMTEDQPATGSTRTVVATDALPKPLPSVGRPSRWRWVGIAVAMLGAVSVGFWFGARGDERVKRTLLEGPGALEPADPAPSIAPEPTAVASDEPSAVVSAESPPTQDAAPPASEPAVSIHSPLPLSLLRIGKRVVTIDPGTRSVEVRLEETDTLPAFIFATTTDGRKMSARIEPGATEVTLHQVVTESSAKPSVPPVPKSSSPAAPPASAPPPAPVSAPQPPAPPPPPP